ncbi:hypothetical protein ASPZODRAFT_126861 [Penicilliopsis zonata CBS 506.65]|uniref:Kinase n=1 Tax=Penicilliopsis zonata CBS 506.65 TaxID=1073090 RepID=A0A1L9SV03_9EURO|nr:hypothetical protein ASPZODRAFT_126861 [Penicilliopsis zonata CBS 506.65]OJJ50893.1 hypothetical protein ASPZODRAFT_126861 [Penicilliopsis zonata CBS 506.65]
MPSSSRSDSLKTQGIDGDSFVAFDHAAAGHEGVRCTTSGSLIAKPCTQQEVDFYESSALHPEFREFIPTYIGTLSSADQQLSLALTTVEQNGAIAITESDRLSVSTDAFKTDTPQSSTRAPVVTSTQDSDTPWTPSGGKKLQTDISIVLENVASGFRRPNVLDVKLGARLWADDAPPPKRAKLEQVSTQTTSGSLGFRIAGMKVWTGVAGETDEGERTNPYETKHEASESGKSGEVVEKGGYRRYNRWYGRAFSQHNVKEGFEAFLAGAKAGPIDRSKLMAGRLADELRRVQSVLEAEESRMYSSSVLIVYEGDMEALELALEEEKKAIERPPRYYEEPEDNDDCEEIEAPEDGSFEVLDLATMGPNGVSYQAINITIDPETAQLADFTEDEDEEEDPPKVHDLRLIDFAHASWTPGQGPDENVLMGVRSLVKIFDEIAS